MSLARLIVALFAVAAGGSASAQEFRLACQLVEHAIAASPEDERVREAYRTIYLARRKAESSLMAKGVFAEAASRAATDERTSGEA